MRLLRDHCRKSIQSSSLPSDPPGPAEREFLRWIADRKPAEEEPAGWRLYTLDDAYPMVVGTRPDRTKQQPLLQGQPVASNVSRVVTWGLAVPMGQQGWNLYSFHPAPSSSGLTGESSVIPLPLGFRRIFSIGTGDTGDMVLAFRGPSEMEQCKVFYGSWCKTHGWTAATAAACADRRGCSTAPGKVREAVRWAGHPPTPDERRDEGLVLVHGTTSVTSKRRPMKDIHGLTLAVLLGPPARSSTSCTCRADRARSR